MTKHEIIDETVEYYTKNPRAVNGKCVYLNDKGHKCAFGRCEINPPLNMSRGITTRFCGMETAMNEALKPEYRGHSMEFWDDLQTLHDDIFFWNDGLSNDGKVYVKKMKLKYS